MSLSDCFSSRQHYEWMLSTLLEVYRAHPHEDELVLQYLIVGVCKAASVTGIVRAKINLSELFLVTSPFLIKYYYCSL